MTEPGPVFDHRDPQALAAAEQVVRAELRRLPRALVAFSGGVDSTLLLALAADELGERVCAVTADSPSLARSELARATAFCRERGIRQRVVATDEFADPLYLANDGLRCKACKSALFRAMELLRQSALEEPGAALLLGALVEDYDDVRPGLQAAAAAGASAPLALAGFCKGAVRALSRQLGLAGWDRPAQPCLSSRVPYGEAVTPAGLAMIEAAEAALRVAGFINCRARHHAVGGGRGFLCRIEVPVAELISVAQRAGELHAALRAIGYQQVALDLGGLRSGGLNDLLRPEERAAANPRAGG